MYADDTLSESVTEFASGTLKLGIKDLTPEVLAELLGQAVDKNSVVWAGKEDEPPYVAVGFRAKKTGGKYRYVWLLKAKFKVPSEKYETKGESIKFNTPDIEASFTTRKKDNGGYEHCNHADRKYTVADYSSITAAYGAGTGAGSSAACTD